MAIAFQPEFENPRDRREVSSLVESIEGLLADYLRRSIVQGQGAVPLSVLIRDLRGLVAGATQAEKDESRVPAVARFRLRRRKAA
jgi:hypothetical protein